MQTHSFFPFLLQTIIWIPTRIILFVFSNFKVVGLENLKDLKGRVIFVSNHTSELDPILLPAALPMFSRFMPIFYVSREKTFYNTTQIFKHLFYGGFFFEIWRAFQTHVGLHNFETSLQTHIKILEDGHSLFIFPEGGKTFDGTIHEAKGGAAFLAHRTNSPVVPIAISGAYKTSFFDFLFFRKNFKLSFGKPLYPEELFANKNEIVPHDYKILMNEVVMPKISELLEKN